MNTTLAKNKKKTVRQIKRAQRGRVRIKMNGNVNLTKYEEYYLPNIPRSLQQASPFPPAMIKDFPAKFTYAAQAGATFSVRDYQINSMFNLDSSGGTTNSYSGTTAVSGIYDIYHVLATSVRVTLLGADSTQEITACIIFRDVQPSTVITTRAQAIQASEVQPASRLITATSVAGMNRAVVTTGWVDIGDVLGNPLSYASDVAYTANFGSDPNNKYWMDILTWSTGGTASVTGAILLVEIQSIIRFFSLRSLQ